MVDFTTPVTIGEDVKMTCSWPVNVQEKNVTWYYGVNIDDGRVLMKLERQDGAYVNIIHPDYNTTEVIPDIRHNYDMEHSITLRRVTYKDDVRYWCVLSTCAEEVSREKRLQVQSKQLIAILSLHLSLSQASLLQIVIHMYMYCQN